MSTYSGLGAHHPQCAPSSDVAGTLSSAQEWPSSDFYEYEAIALEEIPSAAPATLLARAISGRKHVVREVPHGWRSAQALRHASQGAGNGGDINGQ